MKRETRICIKCGRELPLGMFRDNWRHKVNRCNDCIKAYADKYKRDHKAKIKRRSAAEIRSMEGKIKLLEFQLQKEKDAKKTSRN